MSIGLRIREKRIERGLSQDELAERLGVRQPTVSEWEKGKFNPGRSRMRQIAAALQTSIRYLELGHSGDSNHTPALTPSAKLVDEAEVIGRVEAGAWRKAVEMPEGEREVVTIRRDRRYPGIAKYAFDVAGPSMDKLYPDGSTVICVRLIEIGREPVSGERVIVERWRRDGLVEATIKEYVIDQTTGKVWLWPRSNHPAHQAPIPLFPADGESAVEEIRVTYLVVYSIRPETVG